MVFGVVYVVLVEEDVVDDVFYGLVDWCVVEYDVCGFVVQFECEFFFCVGDGVSDVVFYVG